MKKMKNEYKCWFCILGHFWAFSLVFLRKFWKVTFLSFILYSNIISIILNHIKSKSCMILHSFSKFLKMTYLKHKCRSYLEYCHKLMFWMVKVVQHSDYHKSIGHRSQETWITHRYVCQKACRAKICDT